MDEDSVGTHERSWTADKELILTNLLDNIKKLQNIHRVKYISLKQYLTYFRVPLIILSSMNSVFSVGLTLFISQKDTSVINCIFSLVCAIISAIELFLQVQRSMELELTSYHQYKMLAIKISSTLKLERTNREIEGTSFLNQVIDEYKNIVQNSIVNNDDVEDRLFDYVPPTRNILFSSPKTKIEV